MVWDDFDLVIIVIFLILASCISSSNISNRGKGGGSPVLWTVNVYFAVKLLLLVYLLCCQPQKVINRYFILPGCSQGYL